MKIEIEAIYFFEVNTKYISSSAVKIQYFYECVTRVKMLLLSPYEIKHIGYLSKKGNFSFYFILNGNTESKTKLFAWSFRVRFDLQCVYWV